MPRYMLSVHSCGDETPKPKSDADMQQFMQKINRLEGELKSTGAWVLSGRLTQPATAKVVSASSGKVMTTDGPFAETKEQLGGFYIIDANDPDAAMTWASKVTEAVGAPIEVRSFWEQPQS